MINEVSLEIEVAKYKCVVHARLVWNIVQIINTRDIAD